MKCFFVIFIVILIFSCNIIKEKEAKVKYREKDPCESLRIFSSYGDIEVIGWKENFIEINSNKVIYTGIRQDIDQIDTFFERNDNELVIKTRIPSRIEGRNNLKIYVPFIMSKLSVNSENGNVKSSYYLGDIDITHKNGNINILFEGNILRLDLYQSKSNIYIKSYNSTDIVINTEEGTTKINIENLNTPSYMDIKALHNDININIGKNIDHKLLTINKGKNIKINYNVYDKNIFEGYFYSISGKKGRFFSNLSLDVSNEDGQIVINQIDSKNLKKELENLYQ